VINDRKARGIYTINNKYRYTWGKTPCYFFVAQDTNTVDAIMINEINKYRKVNKLTEIKRKDVKHGSRLRILGRQTPNPLPKLMKETEEKDTSLQEEINLTTQAIDGRVKDLKEKQHKDVNATEGQKAYVLLDHLKRINEIDDTEFTDFADKVERNLLTFETLVDELKERNYVTVSEPLDENVEDFIQDLGACSANDMAGFVEDLRTNKRGLKDMTATPVKAFMPASLLFVIILGFLLGIPIMVSQWPLIENAIARSGSGQGGGITMPWDLFGGQFIDILGHIPQLLLGLF
jgi:hypothetical protein